MRNWNLGRIGGLLLAWSWVFMAAPGGGQEVERRAVVVPEDGAPVETPEREAAKPMTVSRSRQFVVHGANLRIRSAVATLAEETREALVKEVGGGEEWKNTIVIELRGKPGDPAPPAVFASKYFALPDGFRLQLFVHLARGIDQEELRRHLLELLVYERCLRGRNPVDFQEELILPAWVTAGLLESFRWRKKEGDRALYAALFERKALFPVERLLSDDEELGPGERDAFRASAGALVMALLGQDGGREGMAGFLREVGTFRGQQLALVMKHFPGMNLGQKSLEKWWALQLARMAEPPVTQSLTILATDAELTRLLVIRFEDGQGARIELEPSQFRDLLALDPVRRGKVVKPVADTLSHLHLGAFPGYRPIITEYLRIMADLLEDRDEELEARLAEVDRGRAYMVETGERTRDLLDWYRITSATEVSGAFEDYTRLKEELEKDLNPSPGPISRYLDDLQKLYGR